MEEDAGRGAPGGEPGLSPGEGEEAQGSDAAGAVAAGGAVRGRRVGLGRSRTGKRQGAGARGVRRDGQTGCEERCRGGGRGGWAKVQEGEGGM